MAGPGDGAPQLDHGDDTIAERSDLSQIGVPGAFVPVTAEPSPQDLAEIPGRAVAEVAVRSVDELVDRRSASSSASSDAIEKSQSASGPYAADQAGWRAASSQAHRSPPAASSDSPR
ncbi:hypothetical protein GCM10009557_49050 [Virgisporangium ochraceum]|uniref:Uncharacterized protein n=1 Tax=Virgisporangium ochraceum TaxID=65505 RepID=A0A8J4EFH3_9ACTN|nr:hypothetical protein Voc01_086220 [Virgisporangium ochraceum]